MGERFNQKKLIRIVCLLAADIIVINLAAVLTLLIRFEFSLSFINNTVYFENVLHYALINTAVTLVVFYLFQLYSSLWEFASTAELIRIVLASLASAAVCSAPGPVPCGGQLNYGYTWTNPVQIPGIRSQYTEGKHFLCSMPRQDDRPEKSSVFPQAFHFLQLPLSAGKHSGKRNRPQDSH